MRWALISALILALTSCLRAGNPSPISVVHTWGDLFGTAPITLQAENAISPDAKPDVATVKAYVSVWLGIDRSQVTTNGVVVIYCASKGISFNPSPLLQTTLGPFRIVVRRPISSPMQMDGLEEMQMRHPHELHTSTFVLCARTVTLDAPGDYLIDLVAVTKTIHPDPQTEPVLAEAKVSVRGDSIQPWSQWNSFYQNLGARQKDADFDLPVSNSAGGISCPKVPDSPTYFQETPGNAMLLPALISDQPDPKLQLTIENRTLLLRGVDYSGWTSGTDCFLVRWWINDQPWIPAVDVNAAEDDYSGGGASMIYTQPVTVRFWLQFHPDYLKAKKGDKIGVQLLYCPEGTQRLGVLEAARKLAMPPQTIPTAFSVLSNRIDFVYSGDPTNWQ